MGALQACEGGRGSSPVSGRVWAKTRRPGFPVPSSGLPHCGEEGTGSLAEKPLLCARQESLVGEEVASGHRGLAGNFQSTTDKLCDLGST